MRIEDGTGVILQPVPEPSPEDQNEPWAFGDRRDERQERRDRRRERRDDD